MNFKYNNNKKPWSNNDHNSRRDSNSKNNFNRSNLNNRGGYRNNDTFNHDHRQNSNNSSNNSENKNYSNHSNISSNNSNYQKNNFERNNRNNFGRRNFGFNNQFQNRSNNYNNRDNFGRRNINRDNDFLVPIKNNLELENRLSLAIIKAIMDDDLPMPLHILVSKTIRLMKEQRYPNYIEKGNIIWVIEKLVNDSTISKNSREKYYLEYLDYPEILNTENEGVFKANIKNNFAFINTTNPDGSVQSFFVHKKNFKGAIDGDLVKYIQLDTSMNQKKLTSSDVKIIEIIKHAKNNYVGEVKIDPAIGVEAEAYYVELDNNKIPFPIRIFRPIGLVEGHKVLIKITDFSLNNLKGEIIKILGHKSDIGVDIESIVYDHGINIDFSELALKEVEKLDYSFDRFNNQEMRQNLTTVPFITIDPSTSKDFDDAIFVTKQNDHFLLRVAIADVSSYVNFKSALDEDAENRGTSVYLVNSVIPMLPHVLSNDLCSLNPNLTRCALVCDIKIKFDGKINFNDVNVFPALIKSHRRFSYDEVNQFFKKENNFNNENPDVINCLNAGYELFFLMEKEKENRGYINFDLPEPKIIVDENNVPIEIKIYERWHAQIMIEDFMIAANETVTVFAMKNNIPFIYRVHGQPNLEKLQRFSLQAKRLNFKINSKIDNNIKSSDIAEWIKINQDNPYNSVLHMLLLRAMDKAYYSEKNIHHFGLASTNYTHFTSPIRRYPDLIVHRLLWMFHFDRSSFTDGERELFKNRLAELTTKNSNQEIEAVQTERDVNSYKFTEYMAQFLGNEFEGIVIEVNAKGVFVQLENSIQGFAPVVLTRLDFFKYDEVTNQLIGRNTNRYIGLCTKLSLKLVKTDLKARSMEFQILNIIRQPL